MSIFVAIDTGGTFTDLVAFESSCNKISYTKSLTTHHDPIEGILACIKKSDVNLTAATLFKHGTTLVINTLIERSGPRVGLITTRGFRDVLELARGNRTEAFNLFFRRYPSLIPRELCLEVDERTDAQGQILSRPERRQIEQAASDLISAGVDAVAVSFLNSYVEPENEMRVAAWLRELLPSCYITTGVELSREWYEYERSSTAVANAYTGPRVCGYIARLRETLLEANFPGQLVMMGSNGGVLAAGRSMAAPITLVESGPVGGCIGAGMFGEALGFRNIIAFDMGGTTAKCALVQDGTFEVESTYYAGGYGRGLPIRAPVIDIVEVGAGGGSIAWLDEQKRLNVGPRSAGSQPGPVAYGRGGTEPTVTDANLILGRINADNFHGGEIRLDLDAARRAVEEKLATPLGYKGEEGILTLASGVLSIAAAKMGEAIKRITVERGKDPSEFVLFAYGGGGPLHAVELARELRIPLVVIPPEAGNFSAVGMLLAKIRRDEARTFLRPLDAHSIEECGEIFARMEAEMHSAIIADFGAAAVTFERYAELRYIGQYHTVRIPVLTSDVEQLNGTFQRIYRNRYGHTVEGAAAEFVSLHCTGKADMPHPEITHFSNKNLPNGPESSCIRHIYHSERSAALSTKAFARAQLPEGFSANGPAAIEEYGSTTVLGPSDSFEIGRLGEIQISIGLGE